jgi:hypothetical protein
VIEHGQGEKVMPWVDSESIVAYSRTVSLYNQRRIEDEELSMDAVQPGLSQTHDLAQTYRELASQCREMAARDPRPGSLLMRANALDATADYVEHSEKQLAGVVG